MPEPMSPSPDAMEAPDAPVAGDLSQGYCIEVYVLPDGTFKVSGPEPLEEDAAEEQGEAGSEMGQDVNSIGEALKAVLAIHKANPVGDDANAQFDAGYAGG